MKVTRLLMLVVLGACRRASSGSVESHAFQDGSSRLSKEDAAVIVYKSFVSAEDMTSIELRRDWSVRLAKTEWGKKEGIDPLRFHLMRMEEFENILHDLQKDGRPSSVLVAKAAYFRAEAEEWVRAGRIQE